jgi:HAD superfamily hydrolase (TIGR01549 family)
MQTDYKAYLFDWDGTLCRTLEIWIGTLREAFSERGITLSNKELGACLGDWKATCAPLPEEDRATFKLLIETRAYEQFLSPPLYDGVVSMLKRLKSANKKIALITTSRREAVAAVLVHHELINLFDVIITGDDVKAHKPDPEGILAAVEQFGLQKSEVVMIGDTDKDLGAAKNAGIDRMLFFPQTHADFYDKQHLQTFNPVAVVEDWCTFCSDPAVQ